MITGLDLNQTVDYSLKKDKKNPTIWKLGVIPSYLFAKILVAAKDNQIDYAYQLVQVALKGWSNFTEDYRTVENNIFGDTIKVVPLEILGKLPLDAISELSEKIMEINKLSDDERKN